MSITKIDPRTPKEINEQITELELNITRLKYGIEELTVCLNSILLPISNTENTLPSQSFTQSPKTPLASTLFEYNYQISNLINIIKDLQIQIQVQ